jgi:hypothetical protein
VYPPKPTFVPENYTETIQVEAPSDWERDAMLRRCAVVDFGKHEFSHSWVSTFCFVATLCIYSDIFLPGFRFLFWIVQLWTTLGDRQLHSTDRGMWKSVVKGSVELDNPCVRATGKQLCNDIAWRGYAVLYLYLCCV